MDKHVADAIWMAAREQGTPDAMVETVVEGLLPSIRLVAQHPEAGEDLRVGGCRIGGTPDLPQGTAWPRLCADARRLAEPGAPSGEPLSFLLQVNLAEAA